MAAGKGVVVCDDAAAASTVLTEWFERNAIPGGGTDIVLEERMSGREISVFAIADGRAMIPIAAACDYKRAGDDDRGPNTGGMGAYSPPAGFPDNALEIVRERIIAPVLRGLLAEDEVYRGVLYCGLMWTGDGPRVVEFNVRFGDPETQVLMPRVAGDFARFLSSAAEGALELDAARFSDDACVGVTLTTDRYPYENTVLTGLPATLVLPEGVAAFWGTSTLRRRSRRVARRPRAHRHRDRAVRGRGAYARLRGDRATQAAVPTRDAARLPLRHRPSLRSTTMAKLRHIAICVKDLEASAQFYEKIFEMTRAYEAKGRAIYLTDGMMNLALLNAANARPAGDENAHGINHFGFRVEDFSAVEAALTEAGATYAYDLGDPAGMNYERKWRDPEGILFDVSEKGWYGALDEPAVAATTRNPMSPVILSGA